MAEAPEPRIADVDRDRASEQLRVAYGEGRISEAELEDRLTTVYEARTASELNVVLIDLPAESAGAHLPAPVRPGDAIESPRSFRLEAAAPLLMPALICTAIYFMTNPGGYFWPMWVWLGWGIPALYAVLGSRSSDESVTQQMPPPAPPEVRG